MSTTTTTSTITASGAPSLAPSGPVEAKLNYFVPPADGSVPYNRIDPAASNVENNYGTATHTVSVTDLRGREADFAVDRTGFGTVTTSDPEADFSSDAAIEATYYPQVRALLSAQLSGNPQHVVIFDHTVRRAQPNAHRAPVMRTHIDQTTRSAAQRVHHHMGAEADALLKGRVRLVNVWRPLNGTVEAQPLAVADSSTVADDLLVPVEHRYPDRTGETAGVKYGPDVRWYYWSAMQNHERLLLQCYDSLSGTRTPHSAFDDPRSTPESKPRESIEVRALIFG